MPTVVRALVGVESDDKVEFVEVEPSRFGLVAATTSVSVLKGPIRNAEFRYRLRL